MSKIRYNVLVQSSSRGNRKADFIMNHAPFRPGTIAEGLDSIVNQQYTHLGFGVRFNGLTKLIVKGIRFKGAGIDGTDIVWMWCPDTKAVVCIKAVRA